MRAVPNYKTGVLNYRGGNTRGGFDAQLYYFGRGGAVIGPATDCQVSEPLPLASFTSPPPPGGLRYTVVR